MNAKYLDGILNISIGSDGLILENGTRRATLITDEDGDVYFTHPSVGGKLKKRYVAVEVYRHFVNETAPELEKGDVKLIDPDAHPKYGANNLELTPKGMEKVFGVSNEKDVNEPLAPEPENMKREMEEGKTEPETDPEDGPPSPPPSEPIKEESKDNSPAFIDTAVIFTAVKDDDSNWYELFDSDGVNVLDVFNGGKRINGKKNVEKIAEANGIEITFN